MGRVLVGSNLPARSCRRELLMSQRGAKRRRRHEVIGSIAALAFVLGVVGAAVYAGDSTRPGRRAQLVDPDAPPLAGGMRTSVGEATSRFDVPVFRPDTEAASDNSIMSIWARFEESPQIYITYQSGIVVTVRPMSEAQGTEKYAAAQLKDGVPGAILEVDGVRAFVVPQSDDGDLGSVRFEVDDAIVTVIGHGDFKEEALLAVASSVVQTADVARAEFVAT